MKELSVEYPFRKEICRLQVSYMVNLKFENKGQSKISVGAKSYGVK
jgi:hypothetical protein